MMQRKLTALRGNVTGSQRKVKFRGNHTMRQSLTRVGWKMVGAIALVVSTGGCINVAAPEKPIVIELNINIRQEVIYQLAEDAANTIEENADIF